MFYLLKEGDYGVFRVYVGFGVTGLECRMGGLGIGLRVQA